MQTKSLGVILIIVGIIMLSYSGFNYVTTERVVDIGPVHINAEKNNFVKLSPVLGVILLIGGVIFLLKSKKS